MKDDGSLLEPKKETLPLEDVGRLVELLAESGVGQIRVKQGDLEITVKAKTEVPPAGTPVEPSAAPVVAETVPEPGPVELNGGLHLVRSPVVGTFYRAPAPGEEYYVEVGDHVGAGQTLCIVEAMKLMNEIESDIEGTIAKIYPQNGQPVEYGEKLFAVKV